jgi:RHS repeat-associated protein
MIQPGRAFSAGTQYRYGFNGKESDDETDLQDYGMRIYNPALARFLSTDPLADNFPWYTPYQFAGNTPIQAIDLDGAEPKWMIKDNGELTEPMMVLLNAAYNYKFSGMMKTKWVNFHLGKSANTILRWVFYSKEKNNYWEHRDYNLWVDFWINLVPHEQKHRNDYVVFGTTNFGIIYGLTSLWSFITTGKFYSDKTYMEKRAYDLEPSIAKLMNMEDGLAIKTLESQILGAGEKMAVLAYVGTLFQLDQANDKLTATRNAAEADGRITKKESKRILRAENKVKALREKADELNTNEVQQAREKLKDVVREPVKDLKEENNKEQINDFNNKKKARKEEKKKNR